MGDLFSDLREQERDDEYEKKWATFPEHVKAQLRVEAGVRPLKHYIDAVNRLEDKLSRVTHALKTLVELKDGPRDDLYRKSKDNAWENAREVLKDL